MSRVSASAGKRVFRVAFGTRLRIVRAALKISQTEAARRAGGFGTNAWSRIERGAATNLPVNMIGGITSWLATCSVSLNWLFLGEGQMFH